MAAQTEPKPSKNILNVEVTRKVTYGSGDAGDLPAGARLDDPAAVELDPVVEGVGLARGHAGHLAVAQLDRVDHLVVAGAEVAHEVLVLLVVAQQSLHFACKKI